MAQQPPPGNYPPPPGGQYPQPGGQPPPPGGFPPPGGQAPPPPGFGQKAAKAGGGIVVRIVVGIVVIGVLALGGWIIKNLTGDTDTAAGKTGVEVRTAAPITRWSISPTFRGSSTPAAPATSS